ncbi:MAG: AraC family transcriptional regulator [Flavobacteriaceae bacterium]|nr:AraC family transcriptional regulator [Flavobacteriaceae bacterium]|tara:strand:+ start:378427 stop:379275 length:849 start_codon:yes stop_codon:yes gene_type:complete
MAIQDLRTYSYQNTFSLKVVDFEKACVVNQPEEVKAYQIFWIKEGKGTYYIDFNKYSFDGNVLIFLSPGQIFHVESEKIKEAYQLSFVRDFYCIQTHDKEISCNGVLFNNIYETPLIELTDKDVTRLELIIEDLIEEFNREEGTAQYDMLQSYLKQFIIHSVRIQKNQGELKTDDETKLFKDFSTLVEFNFKELHSVSDYAERLGLSPKSLTKHFQRISKDSPSDFIKKRIILEAKRKLIYTDYSVKEIAFDLGFNDPAYFTRFFTKATTLSPLNFKKDFKN